jgi:molecular chaperone GrpE (heat shock protein)
MNDNEKFKSFFGFGRDNAEKGTEETPSADISQEKEALEKSQAAMAEWQDKYLSLTADFQNYKKRVTQERAEWAHDAQKQVFLDLLSVIDNFERALDLEKKRESAENLNWLAGFEMIYQALEKLIKKFGVEEMTDFSTFNPKYHEALVQVESPQHKSGEIVQVLQKGYVMNEKVLRPATVSVAK